MTPDTKITFSVSGKTTFEFAGLEVPEHIPWGTSQSLAVHRQVGGARVIDAMGPDYEPLSWSGLLFGKAALNRATQLESLASSGAHQTLTWGEKSFLVVVRSFHGDYQRSYQIPYSITCEVISDNSQPVATAPTPTTSDQLAADGNVAFATTGQIIALLAASSASAATQAAAQAIQDQIEDIISMVASYVALGELISASAPSTIASLLQPLQVVQANVTTLITSTDNSIGALPGFAGVVPGGNPITMAADLDSAVSATQIEYLLLNVQGLLGRMNQNLVAANGSPNTIVTINPNLFALAASQYDDALSWDAIAQANNLSDPFPSGAQTLVIPLQPSDNGGVLNS